MPVFNSLEEYKDAIKNLDRYHDCAKCHSKIVCITIDWHGNRRCAYCNQIVDYPILNRDLFKTIVKNEKISNN